MRHCSGLLLVAGLSAAGATCNKGAESLPPKTAFPLENQAIEKAEAPPITDIEGVDLTQIPPSQRAAAVRILNETFCYFGCPRTLAACLSSRADCSCVRCSERMTDFIIKHFAAGMSAEEIDVLI